MIPRYQTKEMSDIWNYDNKIACWIKVEAEAIRAMGKHNVIPIKDADALYNLLNSYKEKELVSLLAGRIELREEETKHDVAAFVDVIAEDAESNDVDARWFHYGLTSSDIVDTGFTLQIADAIRLIDEERFELISLLGDMISSYKGTPMIGRTHGVWAEPTTFGAVCARWRNDLSQAFRRLDVNSNRLLGKLSGAVGTYSHLSEDIERDVLTALGMKAGGIGSQIVSRQFHADIMNALAILAGVIEKIAVDIRGLQRSEIGELYESFSIGQKGSSAMPHKKNPVLSENLTGLARVIRGYALTAMENQALWHERDISHSSAERMIFPDAFGLMHFMLVRLLTILAGMKIDATRMKENIEATKGKWAAQHVMLQLIRKGQTRDEAYRAVQLVAMEAEDFETTMTHRLFQLHFDPTEIDECFSLDRHLKNIRAIL
jgi:adenylosuccinate lyase